VLATQKRGSITGKGTSATIVSRVLALPLMTVALALAALVGASPSESSASGARVDLRIVMWPEGKQKTDRPLRWTLRCLPRGGTLPRRKRACERLLSLRSPFRGVPKNVACTQIYGGPQVAEVRGSFRGRPVAARFNRTDGCQIERWNRVAFLFPAT
jgi:Subtilisin inhibitor-like